MWRNVDIVIGELIATEVFEEVGDAAAGEVDVGSTGVFGLGMSTGGVGSGCGRRGELPLCRFCGEAS